MIYFTTTAYNAEATLKDTIESILGQTYGDFRYHICDNGSNDGTGDIIREYAKHDSRIVPFFNQYNLVWNPESAWYVRNMMFHLEEEDWFSVLDADDNYELDFLKEMLLFARQECLDFAVCRSDHIREPEGESCNEFVLTQDIIIEGADFGTRFPDYFRFMGARWGKLQKGALFHRMDFHALEAWQSVWKLSHREDTAEQLYFLRHSQRAGVRAKLLHNYHLYRNSSSTQNLKSKRQDNLKMPDLYREFLRLKVGKVSKENEEYIQEVFQRSQRRTEEQEAHNGKA